VLTEELPVKVREPKGEAEREGLQEDDCVAEGECERV